MEENGFTFAYRFSDVLTHSPTAIQIEKKLILNEITFDQSMRLVDLGIRVYSEALEELKPVSEEQLKAWNAEMAPEIFERSLKGFQSLKARMDNLKIFPKIKFKPEVKLKDVVMLMEGLLENGWIEKLPINQWQNYFAINTTANDFENTVSKTRERETEQIDFFVDSFPCPGDYLEHKK